MAEVNVKLQNLLKMIIALEKAISKLEHVSIEDTEFVQDSVVARFKILIESTWKVLVSFLSDYGYADIPSSPKRVIALALEAKIISPQEYDAFVKYISLRNLASHLYDQPQYILVVTAAPSACAMIKKLYDRMITGQLPLI